MAFVFYDTNHDGIICEGDLSRLQTLTKRHSVLVHDYDKFIKLKEAPGVNTTIEKGLP
jgi:Ca2+-binding EF-hand superfamily protein